MPTHFSVEFDVSSSAFSSEIANAILSKWRKAIRLSAPTIQGRLQYELIFGGRRINGFTSTAAYNWIKSPTGLGQLGLWDFKLVDNLLVAMADTVAVNSLGNEIFIAALNLEMIANATPHPATESWFKDWIYDKKRVTDASFVPLKSLSIKRGVGNRSYLPRSFPTAGSRESGFMLPTGPMAWAAPAFLRPSIDAWLTRNINGIKSLVIETIKDNMKRV